MENYLTKPDVLNLPWATLVTLACGYMGYFIAHVGVRDHHKQIDVAFSTLVFGFFAAFAYQIGRYIGAGMLISAAFAVVISCVVGALWRTYGRRLLYKILRSGDVSHADDIPSAWLSLFGETKTIATSLSVKTKDGTILLSESLADFSNKPNGPFVFGSNGDVLMYVTDIKELGGKWEKQDDVDYEDWGTVITHIPASEIMRVRLRRK